MRCLDLPESGGHYLAQLPAHDLNPTFLVFLHQTNALSELAARPK
jgi:hypothetical protein